MSVKVITSILSCVSCAAEGAVGIRCGFDRRFPPSVEFALFADAVYLRAGERIVGARVSDVAASVLRVS